MTTRGTAPRRSRRRTVALPVVLLLLAGVLVAGRTAPGAAAVERLRAFLEFYVGVFTLLASTGAVVFGAAAARRAPIRLRILAQAVHRALALMAVGFLVCHIVLKVIEAHAGVVDAVLPFTGGHGRVLAVGLGTIAGDLLVLVLATGVIRGRFAGHARPWTWRTLHAVAYLMWPLAIAHGLLAGRTAKAWVTWSYIVCLMIVLVAAAGRLPRAARDRRMLRAGRARGEAPAPAAPPGADLPDEEFWSALRGETASWPGGRR